MSAPTQFEMIVLVTTLVVLTIAYTLVKYLWKWPLQNGPGFFMGVEVPAGFYEGPGRTWLKGYRAMLVALHLALAAFFGVCFATERWDLIPLCAVGVLLYMTAMQAFQAWTRHKLGANPPIRPVALALETRRLGDYISWPQEALMATVIAATWWLLLRPGRGHIDLMFSLIVTWMALGLLPGKILVVRFNFPLPAERAEEHYRYQDAMRRNWISVRTAGVWCFVVILFGVALGHAWSSVRTLPWFLWLTISVFTAVWGYTMILNFRRMRMATTMGRDLLPPGSFATPFRRAPWPWTLARPTPWMSRSFLIWFTIWFGGILALVLYSQFR